MRDEQKRKKLKVILIIVSSIAAVLVLSFTGSEIIKRAKVTIFEIKTNNLTCTDKNQINEYLQSITLNYFSFKQDELDINLKKKFFCVGKIETRLSYPDKLILEAWGREALFAVTEVNTSLDLNPVVNLPDVYKEATESTKEALLVKNLNQILSDLKQSSESGVYLVDKEGVVFDQTPGNVNFPRLLILGIKIEIGGQILDGNIGKAGLIYNKLKEIEAPAENIIIIGDKLVVDSKPRIVFSLKKRIDYQTASLQLILSRSKIDSDPSSMGSNNIESIDLRFDKPVVVYSKK